MDGKSKKVLNFMKKNGAELDAFDVACQLKMDEDTVLKLLNGLKAENLVTVRTDEKGNNLFRAAPEQAPTEKRGAQKAKASADDAEVIEPRDKKDKAPRIITENEVLDIGDFSPKAAPAPAPASARVQDDFSDFTPNAAPAPTPAPPPPPPPPPAAPVMAAAPAAMAMPSTPADITETQLFMPCIKKNMTEADISDFSPKAASTPDAAAQSAEADDFDEFSPKAKKAKKVKIKEPKIKVPKADNDGDFEPKEKTPMQLPKNVIPAAVVLLLLIIAFFMGASSGSGKVKKAIDEASANFVKTADFQPVKENADKVAAMEEEIKTLNASLESIKSEIEALKARPVATPAANRRAPQAGSRRR